MKKIIFILVVFITISTYGQKPITINDHIISVSSNYRLQELNFEYLDINSDIKQDNTNDTRRIYFIHGLGGNGSSWSKVPDACTNRDLNIEGFPARKCYTTPPDYNNYTLGSLSYVANNMIDVIRSRNGSDYRDNGMDPSKAILIGHSQGGLVSRTIVHNNLYRDEAVYGPDYGGLITVASPLGGATILNNRQMILDMANNACGKLLEGPVNDRKLINGIFKFFLGDDYISNGCDFATQNILPVFFTKYFHQVTEDYKIGAPWLNTLDQDRNNQKYRDLPKIALYGVEPRDKIFWRTLEWMVNDPNGREVGYFGANSDLSFYTKTIKPIYDHYCGEVETSVKRIEWLKNNRWWIWISGGGIAYYFLQINKHEDRIVNWGKGVDWFENDVNKEWEVITGARTYIPEMRPLYVCASCNTPVPNSIYQQFSGPFYTAYTFYPEFCEGICAAVVHVGEEVVYNVHIKETDGVVTAESANHLPNATKEPIRVFPREFEDVIDKGSSHMQIRNDEGIKEHLNNAFNGDYGRFFYTEPQN